MADIFISYSRKDKAFVQTLHQSLTQSQYDTWVDWEDIPPTSAWWKEIEAGIEAAHTCIFVISPDSVSSEVCRREIDHAVQCRKRLVPIVCRDGFDAGQVHPALAQLNWLFSRPVDDFDSVLQTLIDTLNTDLEQARTHARLLVRSLEWEQHSRNASFLLRGKDLAFAEQWLLQASTGTPPQPTDRHGEYIVASRRSARYRQRVLVGTLSTLLLVALGSAGIALQQRNLAVQRQQEAEANLEAACRNIFGMLDGFEAMEANGIAFTTPDGQSVPVGIIFGREFVRTAHNTFNHECYEVNQTFGWTLDSQP